MKRFLFLGAVVWLAAGVSVAQVTDAGPQGAVLSWEATQYDFGDIFQGDKVEHTFKFANTGTEPLIITNVTTQCGCTAPKGWPRDPVLPGGKGEITLSFNSAGKMGRQNKVATLISNAVNEDGGQLILSGNVLSKKPQ